MDIEKLLSRFQVDTVKNNDKAAFVKLKPKEGEKSAIANIELNVSHKHKYISSVKIIYHRGNYWLVNFSPPKKGPLPKNAFVIPRDGSYKFRTVH